MCGIMKRYKGQNGTIVSLGFGVAMTESRHDSEDFLATAGGAESLGPRMREWGRLTEVLLCQTSKLNVKLMCHCGA
jgi:hypothetical protein